MLCVQVLSGIYHRWKKRWRVGYCLMPGVSRTSLAEDQEAMKDFRLAMEAKQIANAPFLFGSADVA